MDNTTSDRLMDANYARILEIQRVLELPNLGDEARKDLEKVLERLMGCKIYHPKIEYYHRLQKE